MLLKALLFVFVVLVSSSYAIEPIEITVGISNCVIVYIDNERGLMCDVTITCNKTEGENNVVKVLITLPKEAKNVESNRSQKQN